MHAVYISLISKVWWKIIRYFIGFLLILRLQYTVALFVFKKTVHSQFVIHLNTARFIESTYCV